MTTPFGNEAALLDRLHYEWQRPNRKIGVLLRGSPRSQISPVLTTNFDPLIEVALRRAGGSPVRTVLEIDGRFDLTHVDIGQHIVHLHGYWSDGDTLHTPDQLERPRPLLR